MTWTQRNYRRHLLNGLRERIGKEKNGLKLIMLYSFLFDADELGQ